MFLEKHPSPGKLLPFDKDAVIILNSIINITKCELVISSDWKKWVDKEEMQSFYINQCVSKKPIDYTPNLNPMGFLSIEQFRSAEIKNWLNSHKEVKKWVSVDDLNLDGFIRNFVWISEPSNGIKQLGIKDKIIKYLKC